MREWRARASAALALTPPNRVCALRLFLRMPTLIMFSPPHLAPHDENTVPMPRSGLKGHSSGMRGEGERRDGDARFPRPRRRAHAALLLSVHAP